MKRFWDKVAIGHPEGCWAWLGADNGKGYGKFWNSGKLVRAHRFAWELAWGKVPKNRNVLHHCDNRRCVNPRHLFLGTTADNNLDMSKKGRHGSHKLTSDQARAILNSTGRTQKDLAKEYGVSVSTVDGIKHRRKWRHLSPSLGGPSIR